MRALAQDLVLVDLPPVLGGSYFSLQTALGGAPQPPLPFNPFPDLPVYESSEDPAVLYYDDRTVDYAALRDQQQFEQALLGLATESLSPPLPPGGGGGTNPPPVFASYAGLCLWPPQISGGNVTLTLTNSAGDGQPLTAYDVFATTNLSPYVPGLNWTNWAWLGRTTNGQTLFYTVKLSDEQCYYMLGRLDADLDLDGLPDAYETLVSHTLTNAFTLLMSDGLTPDAWYLLHGLNPRTSGVGNYDPDQDGLVNRQEYLWGTDPRRSEGVGVWVSSPAGVCGIP